MKTVSVAMAVYNGANFIRKQLDSIICQLNENDEIVISYDESNDNTLEIIKEYEEKYRIVKVVFNPGRGLFANFENAIRNCNGDYIFISDQDDIWIDKKKDTIIKDFEEKKVKMIIHNGYHIDNKDQIISKDFFSMYSIKRGILRNFIKPRYSGCCMAFAKELKHLILPIPRNVGAYDHWIGMIGECYGEIYFEPSPLLLHRLHGNNVTVGTRSWNVVLSSRLHLLIHIIKCRRH